MDYSIDTKNKVVIINLKGNIDVTVAQNLRDLLQKQIVGGNNNIVINMKDIKHLDSSGLGIFVVAHKLAQTEGGTIKLSNMTKEVKQIFKMTKIDNFFEVYEEVNEAVYTF